MQSEWLYRNRQALCDIRMADTDGFSKAGAMENWIPIIDGFIEADVIRWTENVFERSRRRTKRGKPLRIGERQIIAEVLRDIENGAKISLLVRACRITVNDIAGRHIPQFKPEAVIQRARRTIMRGHPERLLWSDEQARDIVKSKFIGITDRI